MLIIKTLSEICKFLFPILFISALLGCSYFPKNILGNTTNQLQGEIFSQSIIPENSEITLSISPINTLTSPENNLLNYQLHTKEANKKIKFKINLIEKTINNRIKLGISIRIEKNGELIMMSNKITELPRNVSEKIILSVVSIK
ncbi:YbaY family lipoprotein [Providencia sp. Me31A]|uniref:YbaY family lipoprotein n=1 Tax=Providencia sp. Me31A TaxID=3392637 RepID=UPI003D2E66EC